MFTVTVELNIGTKIGPHFSDFVNPWTELGAIKIAGEVGLHVTEAEVIPNIVEDTLYLRCLVHDSSPRAAKRAARVGTFILSALLGQECVALIFTDDGDGNGLLVGPLRDKWPLFDEQYFYRPAED